MLKTKKLKFITSVVIVFTIVCLSIFVDLNGNRHFLQFGIKANAAAELYYYNKYHSNNYSINWTWGGSLGGSPQCFNMGPQAQLYHSYSFDPTIGKISGTGTVITTDRPGWGFSHYWNGDYGRHYIFDPQQGNRWYSVWFEYSTLYVQWMDIVPVSTPTKGTLIQENIIALDGTYPNDGKHTDGYWYVKGIKANNNPILSALKPLQNESLSEADTSYTPQISISDADNNILTCKYYIDSETTARDTKTVSNTTIAQSISFNVLDASILSEGNHSIKYEVSDGIASPITLTVNFKVDKTDPVLGTVSVSSTVNTVSIAGSASDSIAGLHPSPYRYTVGSTASLWSDSPSYTSPTNLIPNTHYIVKFEARDTNGHIATSTQNIYTKAVVPEFIVTNASSYSLDVTTSDNNSSSTQYQISVDSGTKYVTQEGSLTSAPTWITLVGKKATVTGLTPSTTYTFQAKARNGENIETVSSSSASGTTLLAPPGSPANIIATATDNTITVSWDAVNGAIGYDIEADGTVVNTDTATTYTHIGLSPGTPHTYRVRARNAGGAGNWSSPISKSTLPGSPDIPTNLNTIPQSTSVTVTWSSVPGATGYDIEVDGTLVNNGPNTNYIHNSLTPGTHHTYRVRSINPGGKSDWSSYANTTTQLDTLPVPTNFTATPGSNNMVLSWNAVSGASGYDIEVDGVAFDNGTRTSFTHSNLAPGTQHIYRVRSKKSGATSEWSAAVVSATLENVFGTPVNFKAVANDTSISLTWDPVSQAVGYDVEIDGNITDIGTENTCIVNLLMPNSNHTFRVRARSSDGTSEWTSPLQVTTFTLPTPTNVIATPTGTSITTVWQAVQDAESYDMEFDGSVVPGITDTSYTSSGLNPNSQHVIRVRAVNTNGTSNWSLPLTKSTQYSGNNVPSVLVITKKTSMTVMWNAMNDATGYDVEVDGSVIPGVTGTSYTINGISPGTSHTYRVRAVNGSGSGEWSNAYTVSALAEGPSTPTNIAMSANMTSILVSWDQMAGAAEYQIEIDGSIVDNGAGTSYLHTGLNPDTNHTYRIRSKNLSGYSEWSQAVETKTLSSVQTFNISSTVGEEFGLVLSASYIQDLSKYTFTIQYNTEDFDIVDLCGLTTKLDTQAGDISGTDITVTQIVPGTIVFTKTGSAQSWQVWSGIVNSIKFKSKSSGQSIITYTIQ